MAAIKWRKSLKQQESWVRSPGTKCQSCLSAAWKGEKERVSQRHCATDVVDWSDPFSWLSKRMKAPPRMKERQPLWQTRSRRNIHRRICCEKINVLEIKMQARTLWSCSNTWPDPCHPRRSRHGRRCQAGEKSLSASVYCVRRIIKLHPVSFFFSPARADDE